MFILFNYFFFLQKGTPPKLIFVACNFLFLACVPVRFMMYLEPNEEDYYRVLEEAFLVFAVPGKYSIYNKKNTLWSYLLHFTFFLGSWFYLVFFCGAIKLTGPFVVMIYAMIMGDMYTFSIIYIIFLFGFTQAFFYLIKSTEVSSRFTNLPLYPLSTLHLISLDW